MARWEVKQRKEICFILEGTMLGGFFAYKKCLQTGS